MRKAIIATLAALMIAALAFATGAARFAAPHDARGNAHLQFIVGTDATGYVNFSGDGVVYARGQW